ncbi:MAG TPA: hypothetical protein VFJ19_20510 [Nocardioidaceae bacterium]|nr:hypothetical protein [Nocardioidaceae bacterium]
MQLLRTATSEPTPVEQFKPTSGQILGVAGVACAVFTVVYVAAVVHTVVGLRVGIAAAFVAILVWATQLRPRATAYPHTLLLKNSVTDTEVPLAAIDEVGMGQTLAVWVGDKKYVCVGIGDSVRAQMRTKRRRYTSPLGESRLHEFIRKAEMAAPDQTAMTYQTFVVTKIEELVEQAKKGSSASRGEVRRRPALPEVVGLAVTLVAFVVACLL